MSAHVHASLAADAPSGGNLQRSHDEHCAHSAGFRSAAIAASAAAAASAASLLRAAAACWATLRFSAAALAVSRRLISLAHAVAYRRMGGAAVSITLFEVDELALRWASCHVIPCAAAVPAGEQ